MSTGHRRKRKRVKPCKAGHVASENKKFLFSFKNCVSVGLLFAKILVFVIEKKRER